MHKIVEWIKNELKRESPLDNIAVHVLGLMVLSISVIFFVFVLFGLCTVLLGVLK